MASTNGWPVWYELVTPDPAALTPFYRAVLDWEIAAEGNAMPNGSEYRMIGRADDGNAGGVLTLSPGMRDMGMQPGWLTYFFADDVDALCRNATELGGAVHLPPTDMPGAGRIAMLTDPQGAAFYLIRPTPPPGQPDPQSDVFSTDKPSHCRWNELGTTDAPAADDFYKALFGWSTDNAMPMGPAGDYRFIELGGTTIGAISPMLAPGARPGWLPYFGVPDIDAAREALAAHGGATITETHQVPGGDWIFHATDPAGAALGIVGPKGA